SRHADVRRLTPATVVNTNLYSSFLNGCFGAMCFKRRLSGVGRFRPVPHVDHDASALIMIVWFY
ncbi:hypothetical protein, partial [Rhodanobacter sp. B04]|uniref:hypothetical protein n=1 Tax=Rhodanobacter sp. B04 TaxID=1945860 RepID=UPI001C2B9F9B